MKMEMERVVGNVSPDFDAGTNANDGDGDDNASSDSGPSSGSGPSSATAEEAALVERAKRATGGWPVIAATELPGGDALALHEVRVMKSYRPRLLREGSATAMIRREIIRALSTGAGGPDGRGRDITAEDIFWDGICEDL
jgi:hypothetical protein